jgi:uncharacterized protein (TIGR02453 family)
MSSTDRLPQSALQFLSDLRDHNDRDWYAANKDRCADELIEPCRALVRTVVGELADAFPRITGSDKKSGGSLTRLHRDTRFGKDKRPYNSHIGLHFWHEDGKKMQVPGFFVRIDPDEVMVATGYHGPDKPQLLQIREAIDSDPDGWAAAAHGGAFTKAWGGLDGEALKRVPKPWDAEHPHGDDLRRKDFTAFARWKAGAATRAGFAGRLADQWRASDPLMAFLCGATGLPW